MTRSSLSVPHAVVALSRQTHAQDTCLVRLSGLATLFAKAFLVPASRLSMLVSLNTRRSRARGQAPHQAASKVGPALCRGQNVASRLRVSGEPQLHLVFCWSAACQSSAPSAWSRGQFNLGRMLRERVMLGAAVTGIAAIPIRHLLMV